MWFGTKDRLNRFDGYRFQTFEIPARNGELSRDLISCLAIDGNGKLWVGSQKGLFWFDAQQEKLVPFLDSIRNIRNLMFDQSGQLWMVAANTLYSYRFQSDKLTRFSQQQYFAVNAICQSPDGGIWVASTDGYLNRYRPTSASFQRYNLFDHSPTPPSRWIEKILFDGNGSILIGTHQQGIKRFVLSTSQYEDLLTQNADGTRIYVRDILQVGPTEFWMATESGVFIYNEQTNQFTNLKKSHSDPYSLSDNAVYNLYKDREGGIWAGTYFGGVNYYPKQFYRFQKFFPGSSTGSISGSAVREICQDRYNNLWVGTEDGGLNKLEKATGHIRHFVPNGAAGSISAGNIHGLLAVDDDLWIGTFQHGLDVMDIRTGKVKKHYTAGSGPYSLPSNFTISMLRTRNGEIYIGTDKGLYHYIPAVDGFSPVPGLGEEIFVGCLMEAKDGSVWGGTHGRGIFYFNPATKQLGFNPGATEKKLASEIINSIYQDSFGDMWVAAEGSGLYRLNADGKSIARHTTSTGFASNFVFKVLEDEKQTLWITTSKGLVSLHLATGKQKVFTKADGLLNDQFNYNSGFRDNAGSLYFGSVKGLVAFNPLSFHQSTLAAPVYITGFQLANQDVKTGSENSSVLKQAITHTTELTLPYNRSTFSLDFAAVGFTSPETTPYSYLMDGLDKSWTHITTNRRVYFTDLQPGSYTFRVKTGNGISGEKEARLSITITAPWWATGWAYAIYITIGGLLLYYPIRAYHIRQENKKEKEIYEAKFDFFVNIAHEIKTPLTLIKGPVENLSEMTGELPAIKDDVSMMERNTDRLVNLVNQILDFRQTETKGFSLDFTDVNMNEQLREAWLTFEPVAKKRKLAYDLELPRHTITTAADAEALNKIFSNLVGNAVKYAGKSVRIKLIPPKKDDANLCIEITNDGFLIPLQMRDKIFEPFFRLKETASQKGSGIGLALARSLTELHNGSLYMKEAGGGQNVFVLRLPYFLLAGRKKAPPEAALRHPPQPY